MGWFINVIWGYCSAGHGYCLEDKPDSNLLYNDDENSVDDNGPSFSQNGIQQPGEVFSEHKQCEFVFGPNSQLCSYMVMIKLNFYSYIGYDPILIV